MAIELDVGDKLMLLAQGLDQLDIGLTVFDRDLVLVAANKCFQQLLNFPDFLCKPGATMRDALLHNASQGEYGPGDIEALVQSRLELSRQFLPHRFERVRPDGSIIEVCGSPLPHGGMVTTYTDVTVPRQREQALRELSAELERRVEERTAELKHREEELAHKASLLEIVVSNVKQGISYTNSKLELELCNPKFGELLELPPELCTPGISFEKLAYFNAARGEYGPGDVGELAQARIAVAKQGRAHRFERTRPSDGKTLEIMGCPTPDGGMVSTYLDISERKESERALQQERERLNSIVSGTNAGTMVYNLLTDEVQVNDRWANMLGYSLEELGPVTITTLRRVCHPDDLPHANRVLAQHLKGLSENYQYEHRVLHKEGRWVWVAAHGLVSERNAQGYATRMAGVHLDITVRKEAEERIRELNESLEVRVAERSSQLSAAMQTLHRSQEALAQNAAKATLSTLVASVSHELSTPLGNSLMTVSTCSALARATQTQMETGQLKRSELTDFLRQIGHGTDLIERNLHRSVELMRNFKQVAADQASEQRRRFELASVVSEVLDTLSPTLKRYAHAVQVDVPRDVWLDSFPGALGQVIINLVNNAYLHAFDSKPQGTVRIAGHCADGRARIAVSDDGSGMTEEHMAQLFQPFFSTKIGRGGTGLGMTIVENLVNKTLGGTLQVESKVGIGTTFAFTIPLVGPSRADS